MEEKQKLFSNYVDKVTKFKELKEYIDTDIYIRDFEVVVCDLINYFYSSYSQDDNLEPIVVRVREGVIQEGWVYLDHGIKCTHLINNKKYVQFTANNGQYKYIIPIEFIDDETFKERFSSLVSARNMFSSKKFNEFADVVELLHHRIIKGNIEDRLTECRNMLQSLENEYRSNNDYMEKIRNKNRNNTYLDLDLPYKGLIKL